MADKPAPTARPFDVPGIIVTVLIAIVALCLVWPQIFPDPEQPNQMNLPNLGKRAVMLRPVTNPIQRDSVCIGLSALGRQIDQALQPSARVYLADMLGPTNAPALGYYYFLRNYLFPRDVEISLGPVVFHDKDIEGTGSDSPDVIKSNGFDIILAFPNNQIQAIPLTTNGIPVAPKSQ
jgi:hypothetical protein